MLENSIGRDLRCRYAETLLTVANEVGSVDRTSAGAVALSRIRVCLGVPRSEENQELSAAEKDVRVRLVHFVLALKNVLRELGGLDSGEENQRVVSDLERGLGELLE